MSNQTGFRQGRLGIGRNPIFPLDISGSTRIEGDLILGGTIADINGTPIKFGGVTSTLNVGTNMPIPEMTITEVPSWEDSVTVEGAGKFLDGASSGDIYYNGGNIGIGTTSPTHVFHTVGSEYSDSVNSLSTSVTYAKLRFQTGPEVNGSSLSKFQGTTGTGATTRWYNQISNGAGTTSYDMLINPFGGNVGIGTTNPLTKLQISDSGNSTLKIVSTNATSPGIELIRTIVNQSSHHDSSVFADDAWTDWKIYNNNSKLEFQGGYRTASSGNHLSTSPQTLVTAMTLMNTGNVGIGATDPKAKLHVKGGHLLVTEGEKSKDETGGCIQFHSVENGYDTDMWGQDYAHSLIADVKYGSGGYDDKTEMLFFKGNNKDGSYGPDRFHFVGAADFRITLGSPGDATGKHGHEAARQHSSWANGEEATFIVKANGNVGIGETSPDTKLEIKSLNSGTVFTGNLKAIHYNQSEWITMGYGGISTGTTHSLRFGVNNSEKMRIDNDGNVGIGTTDPAAKLEVNGTTTAHTNTTPTNPSCLIYGEYSGENLWVGHPNQSQGIQLGYNTIKKWTTPGAATSDHLYFNVSGSTDMVIHKEGNVGIGTTSPYSKLEIKGDDYTGDPTNHVSYLLRLSQEYTQDFDSSSPEGGVGMKFLLDNQNNNAWAVGEIYCYCSNNDNKEGDSSMRFRVSDHSTHGGRSESTEGANVDAMTIHHTGNVGIGTTNPGAKLHVNGKIFANDGNLAIPSSGTYGSSGARLVLWPGSSSGYPYAIGMNSNTMWFGIPNNQRFSFYSDNNEIMRIQHNGNVGIGTTDPGGWKLKVSGSSRFDRAAFGDDDLNYAQVAIMSSPYRTNLLMGRASASSTYHGRWMYGGHHIDIYASSTTQGEASKSSGAHMYLNYYSHYDQTGLSTMVGGALSCGYSGGDYGAAGAGRKVLHIGATYGRTGFNWGWWIGGQNEGWSSSDGDLYFHVCRGSTTGHDAGYLQDSNSGTLMNFTGQHRTFVKDIPHKKTEPYVGLIVSANQNKYIKMGDKKMGGVETGNKAITISEALPVVALTTKEKDKSCFGVICDVEDEERREFGGNFTSIYQKEKGDTRTFINSLGEGGIWVTNKNGNLESGDYITSSIIPGYGQKQDSEFLANYTAAKITMDCDFNPQQQKVKKIKKHDIKVTYYKSVIPKEDAKREWHDRPTPYYDYKEEDDEWVSILDEKNYNALKDEEWDGDWENPTKSCYTAFEKDELENDMDENNEFIWEDTDEYEYAYNLRYLLEDGTQITKQEYETKKANNETVYIAAFVGCTYHCG